MAIDLTKVTKSQLPKNTIINASIAAGSIVLAIILWILFVNPKTAAIRELKVKINSVSGLNEAETLSLTKEKDKLVKEKNVIANKMTLSKDKLFRNKDISSVLDRFLSTAKKRKLEFTYIKPLSKKEETLTNQDVTLRIKETPVALEMQARFTEFLGFLWETEHSDQAFKIIELTIEKPNKKTLKQKEKLTVNIYQLIKDEDEKNE